jgi:ketosteroid isomerase-like protein
MTDQTSLEPARDPQELERFLVARQRAGNIEGMMVLFEPDAVVDCGGGRFLRGAAAIRAYYEEVQAKGHQFAVGEQRPALINGDFALTSTKLPDGQITSEVARRQSDGTWKWIIDRYNVVW